jgi:hypothetical protein
MIPLVALYLVFQKYVMSADIDAGLKDWDRTRPDTTQGCETMSAEPRRYQTVTADHRADVLTGP